MQNRARTIAVDLDGTLAHYGQWDGNIGAPVPDMVARVQEWMRLGYAVEIFTARVAALHLDEARGDEISEASDQYEKIREWCREHIGCYLPVTAVKDMHIVEIWDDRAVRVEKNTGRSELHDAHVILSAAGIADADSASLIVRLQELVDKYVAAIQAEDYSTYQLNALRDLYEEHRAFVEDSINVCLTKYGPKT